MKADLSFFLAVVLNIVEFIFLIMPQHVNTQGYITGVEGYEYRGRWAIVPLLVFEWRQGNNGEIVDLIGLHGFRTRRIFRN